MLSLFLKKYGFMGEWSHFELNALNLNGIISMNNLIWVLLEKLNMNATSGTVVKNSFLKSKGGHINIAYNFFLRDFFQEFIMLSFC